MARDGLRMFAEPDATSIRAASLIPGLSYPLWHLFAPAGAADPWWAWFAIGGGFLVVAALSFGSWTSPRTLQRLYLGCVYLCATHLFLLAHVNDMQLFYAVGSGIAPVAAASVLRTRRILGTYLIYVGALAAALFALEPDITKAVAWGASFTVLLPAYYRLVSQSRAVRAARDLEEELERRVEERTRELAEYARRLRQESGERERLEEQLRFSHRMEALGRLAGGIAHDFNNLLTAIGGYTVMLRDQVGEGEAREDLAQIDLAVQQATALVQQLLSFARSQVVPTRILDLNEVISSGCAILRTLLAEDTELRLSLADDLDPIRANRNQVQQVLLNLAINARDAMPGGGHFTIETSVRTRQQLDPELASLLDGERWVLLRVSDSGIGMEREIREQAFDPFFTTKGVEQGTGLGLSIVYGIVRQRNGHIRLDSEPGEGTRFEIYWPSALGAERPATPAHDEAVAAGRGESILLVEDRDDVRRLVQRILSRNGYRVTEARDGKEAMDVLEQRGDLFDLVVSDVIMPEVSGIELLEHLASARPELDVLLISGHMNHPAVRAKNLEREFNMLPKPFAPADLLLSVRGILDRRRPRTGR